MAPREVGWRGVAGADLYADVHRHVERVAEGEHGGEPQQREESGDLEAATEVAFAVGLRSRHPAGERAADEGE